MFLNRACPVQAGPIPHWAARERPVVRPSAWPAARHGGGNWQASTQPGDIVRSGPWCATPGTMSRHRRCCRSWPTKTCCCALTTRNNGGSWPASARLYSLPRSPGANQVWQFEFSEYETISGGLLVSPITSRRHEFGWHWSPTANQHNFIAGVEFALAEAEAMLDGVRLVDHLANPVTAGDRPLSP